MDFLTVPQPGDQTAEQSRLAQLGSLGSLVGGISGFVSVLTSWAGIPSWLRWGLLGTTIGVGLTGVTLLVTARLRARADRLRFERADEEGRRQYLDALRAAHNVARSALAPNEARGRIHSYVNQLGNLLGSNGTIVVEQAMFHTLRENVTALCRILGRLSIDSAANGEMAADLAHDAVKAIGAYVAAMGRQSTPLWTKQLAELVDATNDFMAAYNQVADQHDAILGTRRFYPDQKIRIPT